MTAVDIIPHTTLRGYRNCDHEEDCIVGSVCQPWKLTTEILVLRLKPFLVLVQRYSCQ